MNLSPVIPHLTDRRAAILAGAVETLEAGVAAGSIRNVDFNDAKDTLNRAIEEATEAFLKTGPRDQDRPHLSAQWHAAYYADAFVSGASNVASALKRAKKVDGLKAYAEFLAVLMPLVDLLAAAKPLIVKRQDQPKVVSPKQAAKLAKSMTCQCCGRAIFAETGVIAHHGYERPGFGYQTASCMGARELPFEVSRDRLGDLIEALQTKEARDVRALTLIEAEKQAIVIELVDYEAKRDVRTGQRPTKSFTLTRSTFDAIAAENAIFRATAVGDFDAIKDREVRGRRVSLKNLRDEIKAQQARFGGWKQTHIWTGKTWKSV